MCPWLKSFTWRALNSFESFRADSRFAPSQWETTLLCNNVSHWLGLSLDSALFGLEDKAVEKKYLKNTSRELQWYYFSQVFQGLMLQWCNKACCIRISHETWGGSLLLFRIPLWLFYDTVEICHWMSWYFSWCEIPNSLVASTMKNGEGLQLIPYIIAWLVIIFLQQLCSFH